VELIWLTTAPALILLLFFTYARPSGSFQMYYSVLFCVGFTASSAGHALAEQNAIENPSAVGIYINLFFAMLCGFSPAQSDLPPHLTDFSYLSFPFFALVNGEYYSYPPAMVYYAQVVLVRTLKTCEKVNGLEVNADPVIVDCPLDCDWSCVQGYMMSCIAWGLMFRAVVIFGQFIRFAGAREAYGYLFYDSSVRKGLEGAGGWGREWVRGWGVGKQQVKVAKGEMVSEALDCEEEEVEKRAMVPAAAYGGSRDCLVQGGGFEAHTPVAGTTAAAANPLHAHVAPLAPVISPAVGFEARGADEREVFYMEEGGIQMEAMTRD
jgi:hypothetical protein